MTLLRAEGAFFRAPAPERRRIRRRENGERGRRFSVTPFPMCPASARGRRVISFESFPAYTLTLTPRVRLCCEKDPVFS